MSGLASAWKRKARSYKRMFDALWDGEFDCPGCGLITNNGRCRACMTGTGPLQTALKERDEAREERDEAKADFAAKACWRDCPCETRKVHDKLDAATAENRKLRRALEDVLGEDGAIDALRGVVSDDILKEALAVALGAACRAEKEHK